ncbi:MAG: hypothetical protein RR422_09840, partial [Erysipelothrix sp.]
VFKGWKLIEDEKLEELLMEEVYNYYPTQLEKVSLTEVNRLLKYLYTEHIEEEHGMKFLTVEEWESLKEQRIFAEDDLIEISNFVAHKKWEELIEICLDPELRNETGYVVTCYGSMITYYDESKIYTLDYQKKFNPFNLGNDYKRIEDYLTDSEIILLNDNQLKIKNFLRLVLPFSGNSIEHREGLFLLRSINEVTVYKSFEDLIDSQEQIIRSALNWENLTRKQIVELGCERLLTPSERFFTWYEEYKQMDLSMIFNQSFFEDYVTPIKVEEIMNTLLMKNQDGEIELRHEDVIYLQNLVHEIEQVQSQTMEEQIMG